MAMDGNAKLDHTIKYGIPNADFDNSRYVNHNNYIIL